ncbi:orotate phosphoribosyltransferase [Candidatus Palauibacter sp.]|uniref:orotate phosphoribosyltransferase n=1 Tax=Candidatus Palauibacter sp. TaxID=3101350 RepID=UPI003C70613C
MTPNPARRSARSAEFRSPREERPLNSSRETLLNLLAERSFRLGDFKLASGARSDYYIDCRTSTMHAHGQVLLGSVGFAAIREAGLRPDAVGGLTMGADPLAYAIAAASWREGDPIHAFSVRKRAKRHGKGQLIEGCFEPGARVVIVEDVITTGGSAFKACEAVNQANGDVLGILGLVDREEGGRAALERAGLHTIVLYTASDLRAAVAVAGPAPA